VVLIERGSEVGGGDTRTTVGTVVRLVEATRFEDGRWAIAAVGLRRIRVQRWLPDDPFPIADVEDWPDESGEPAPGSLAPLTARFRRVLALATELGVSVPPATVELSDDPAVAVLQMSAVAPLGPADHYDLLSAPGVAERAVLLDDLLEGQVEMLEARVASGGDDPLFGDGDGEGTDTL